MTLTEVYYIYQDIKTKRIFIAFNKKFLIEQYKFFNLYCSDKHIQNFVNVIGCIDRELKVTIYDKPTGFKYIVKEALLETIQDLTK